MTVVSVQQLKVMKTHKKTFILCHLTDILENHRSLELINSAAFEVERLKKKRLHRVRDRFAWVRKVFIRMKIISCRV